MAEIRSLTDTQMAKVLNEWMRRYVEEPEKYEHELTTVREFLSQSARGKEPDYGTESAAYMMKIARELFQMSVPGA